MARTRDEHLRRERDTEIYRLYKEARDLLPRATDSQLFNVVATLSAPSFYMDAETCAKWLGILLRGGDLSDMPRHRRTRYYSLYRNYAVMRSQGRTEGRPLIEVAEELVAMPAPSFWLEPDAIRKIVSRCRREERGRLYERAR